MKGYSIMFQVKSQHFFHRYLKFIEYCRTNLTPGYTELHHIIPKSMGGSDDDSNLIRLTARQHFIAHHLLWKSYQNKETNFAFWAMRMKNNKNKLNSKTYSLLKKQHSLYQSDLKKIYNPMFEKNAKIKISNYKKGKTLSKETKAKMSAARKGMLKSDITKLKISKALIGKEKSVEHKLKLSKNHADVSGSKNPMFGKSAIKEKNLKWYTNGIKNKFIPEHSQSEGWYKGRTIKTF